MSTLLTSLVLGLAPFFALSTGCGANAVAGKDEPTGSSPAKTAPAPAASAQGGASGAPAAAANASTDPVEALRAFIATQNIDKTNLQWRTKVPKPPKLAFPDDMRYLWKLDTTEGPITIDLMTKVAPMHVSSTMYLTELGFYDTLLFHRVIPGFMAQGGCPLGTGTGGPAYKYAGEFDKKVTHDRAGRLSMANAGPGTDGSQFFITFGATGGLNGKHTVFGQVIEGMETLKNLEKYGTNTPEGKTTKEMSIRKATIVAEKIEKKEEPPAEEPKRAE